MISLKDHLEGQYTKPEARGSGSRKYREWDSGQHTQVAGAGHVLKGRQYGHRGHVVERHQRIGHGVIGAQAHPFEASVMPD